MQIERHTLYMYVCLKINYKVGAYDNNYNVDA